MEKKVEDNINASDQDQFVELLMNDAPCISQALKNFISIKIAHQSVASTKLGNRDSRRASAAAASARSEQSSNNDGAVAPTISSTSKSNSAMVIAFARAVVGAVNNLNLPDVVQWGASNPQAETQLAMQRMTELSEYKALHLLWTKVKASADAKASKLFGREFLVRIWKQIREDVLKRSVASYNFPAPEQDVKLELEVKASMERLIEELEITLGILNDDTALDGNETEGEGESELDLLRELVWVHNYDEALRNRSEARKQRALEQLEKHNSGIEQLGELLTSHVEVNSQDVVPQVEELSE